jgi:hypothetical protein
MHLGTNKKPIKHDGEGLQISSTISKQAQVHSSYNISLEKEVMSGMPTPRNSFI